MYIGSESYGGKLRRRSGVRIPPGTYMVTLYYDSNRRIRFKPWYYRVWGAFYDLKKLLKTIEKGGFE